MTNILLSNYVLSTYIRIGKEMFAMFFSKHDKYSTGNITIKIVQNVSKKDLFAK